MTGTYAQARSLGRKPERCGCRGGSTWTHYAVTVAHDCIAFLIVVIYMFILILFHPFHPTTYYLDAPSLDIPALYIGLRSSRLRAAAPLSIPSLQLPRSRPKSGLASSYLCCVAHETRLIYASPRALCMCEFVAQRCLPSCAAARTEAFKGLPRPSRAGRPRHPRDARGPRPHVPLCPALHRRTRLSTRSKLGSCKPATHSVLDADVHLVPVSRLLWRTCAASYLDG